MGGLHARNRNIVLERVTSESIFLEIIVETTFGLLSRAVCLLCNLSRVLEKFEPPVAGTAPRGSVASKLNVHAGEGVDFKIVEN